MIREYNESDYNDINQLGKLLKPDFDLSKNYNSNVEKIYVYEQENKIIGFIQILNSFNDIDIVNISVDINKQNQGIGSLLVNYIVDNLKPNKMMLEVRESNLKAISFYQHLGFKEIHRRKKYYNNEDAIIMEMI